MKETKLKEGKRGQHSLRSGAASLRWCHQLVPPDYARLFKDDNTELFAILQRTEMIHEFLSYDYVPTSLSFPTQKL